MYASHQRYGIKEDPRKYGSPKIYYACANCDDLHGIYLHEHASYPHDELFVEHRSNQFSLRLVLHLNMEEECLKQLFWS